MSEEIEFVNEEIEKLKARIVTLEAAPRPSNKVIYKAIKNFLVNDLKVRDEIQKTLKDELSKGLNNFIKWNETWLRGLVRAHLGTYTAELLKSKWDVKIEPQITIQEIK